MASMKGGEAIKEGSNVKSINEIKRNKRLQIDEIGIDGGWGYVYFPGSRKAAFVVFSWGGGWDHVSVSFQRRCPTWEEMCIVKDIFFRDDECVVQYHPAKKDYVNMHPYCLHLWRPQNEKIPMPPKILV